VCASQSDVLLTKPASSLSAYLYASRTAGSKPRKHQQTLYWSMQNLLPVLE